MFDAVLRGLAVALILLAVAVWAGSFNHSIRLSPAGIRPVQGSAFAVADLPAFAGNPCGTQLLCPVRGDSNEHPTRSKATLLENGQSLGSAHSVHADIIQRGHGRYSHWHESLVFSASDNSDPRTNGRSYTIRLVPDLGRLELVLLAFYFSLLLFRHRGGLAQGLPEIRFIAERLRQPSVVALCLVRILAPVALGVFVLLGSAAWLMSRDPESGFFGQGVSVDTIMVKAQRDRISAVPTPEVAFFGDSSCLTGIDVPRLSEKLSRSMESFCTLAFAGPESYARMIGQLVTAGHTPGKIIIVLNPIQFQRQDGWDSWLPVISAGLPPLSGTSPLQALDYLRRGWFDRGFYMPLPGAWGRYYGSASQLTNFIYAHRGTAIDPGTGLNFGSEAEFLRESEASERPAMPKRHIDHMNAAFRKALAKLASRLQTFGSDKAYLLVTPMQGANLDEIRSARDEIRQALGIRPENVIDPAADLPNSFFSIPAHLNRWGREIYTDALIPKVKQIFGRAELQ
jgi:hypothetical protein